MSPDVPTPPPDDPVLRDDELLDAIRRGTPPPADDPVAALLADWHTELVSRAAELDRSDSVAPVGLPARPDRPAAGADPDPTSARPGHTAAPGTRATAPGKPSGPRRAAASVPAGGARPTRSGAGRTSRRHGRVLTGAALTLLAVTGGLWLGAARAEPGGLLWPVTELAWTDRADSLLTEREISRTLEQARRDLTAARYGDARARLQRATALLPRLGDDERAARLRADIDELRHGLPGAGPTAPPTSGAGATTPPSRPAPPPADPAGPSETAPDEIEQSAASLPVDFPSPVEPSPERTTPLPPRRPDPPAPATPGRPPAPTTPATGDGPREGHRPPAARPLPPPAASRPAAAPAKDRSARKPAPPTRSTMPSVRPPTAGAPAGTAPGTASGHTSAATGVPGDAGDRRTVARTGPARTGPAETAPAADSGSSDASEAGSTAGG